MNRGQLYMSFHTHRCAAISTADAVLRLQNIHSKWKVPLFYLYTISEMIRSCYNFFRFQFEVFHVILIPVTRYTERASRCSVAGILGLVWNVTDTNGSILHRCSSCLARIRGLLLIQIRAFGRTSSFHGEVWEAWMFIISSRTRAFHYWRGGLSIGIKYFTKSGVTLLCF